MPKGENGWKPGESGNPSGKSGVQLSVIQSARAMSHRALKTLEKALDAERMGVRGPYPDWPTRVHAANSILDRGLGKPTQPFRIEDNIAAENMTDAELIALAYAAAGHNGGRPGEGGGGNPGTSGAPPNPDKPSGLH